MKLQYAYAWAIFVCMDYICMHGLYLYAWTIVIVRTIAPWRSIERVCVLLSDKINIL